MIRKPTAKASISTKTAVTESGSKTPHKESTCTKTADIPCPAFSPNSAFGVVKFGAGVTFSRNYQSSRVDVGIECPWPCRPGHPEDLLKGLDAVKQLVEDEMEDVGEQLQDFLSRLNNQ